MGIAELVFLQRTLTNHLIKSNWSRLPIQSTMSNCISIQSSDGEVFKVEMEVAKKSKTIQTMLEDLGIEVNSDEDITETLPLPSVNSLVLRKVIDWCRYHLSDPEPMQEDQSSANNGERKQKKIVELDAWDKEFVTVDKGILLDIIMAANYLHIPGLIEMGCMTVASMVKGKSASEIRKEWNIKNDFTPNPGFENDPIFQN